MEEKQKKTNYKGLGFGILFGVVVSIAVIALEKSGVPINEGMWQFILEFFGIDLFGLNENRQISQSRPQLLAP